MSWFGDNTFKQDILDEVEVKMEEYGITRADAVGELAEVLVYFSRRAFNRDEEMSRVRQEAYETAKAELKAKLNAA